MKLIKETKWLCENARTLEKFSGKCVMFVVDEGVVSQGETLDQLLEGAKKWKIHDKPFLFHVPSKNECLFPVPGLQSSSPKKI